MRETGVTRPSGVLLAVGVLLACFGWFLLGAGVQDTRANGRAAAGEGRAGTVTGIEEVCPRSGCVPRGRFREDGGRVIDRVTVVGPLAPAAKSARARYFGHYDDVVYVPGVSAAEIRADQRALFLFLFGGFFAVLGGACGVLAWRSRAGLPLVSRWKGERRPADTTELAVVRSRGKAVAEMLVVGTVTAVAFGLVLAVDWDLSPLPGTGLAAFAVVVTVLAPGAFAQLARTFERPRVWLTPDALIVRDPALFTRPLVVPKSAIRRVRAENLPRTEMHRAAVLSPFAEPAGRLLRIDLAERAGEPVSLLRQGWNGTWVWRLLGPATSKTSQTLRTSVAAQQGCAPFGLLLIRFADRDAAAAALTAWLPPLFEPSPLRRRT